jgi:hypothetical protein
MKIEVIAKSREINDILNITPLTYKEAVKGAFKKIEQNEIVSSWKDSTISGRLNYKISDYIKVPEFGCYKDVRKREMSDYKSSIDKIWSIGGKTGWYYANSMWRLRGLLDKMIGGVGLRRGRTNQNKIHAGDTLDFWRVLYANKQEGRLLLFAEMKLPGEAWLEFRTDGNNLIQTATFRPKGLLGRLYWFSVLPMHGIVFRGMINRLSKNHKIN